MLNSYIDKAKILLEALPYIQKFSGKTIVVKYGGAAMENEDLKKSVAKDLVLLRFVGIKVVLIHGGGKEITSWLNKLNLESEFINGVRKTSKEVMEVTEMVLTGKINKSIVAQLNSLGGKAIGLSGRDDSLIKGHRIDPEKLGYAGEVDKINIGILQSLLADEYIPVVSTIGFDEENNSLNINADYAAEAIASALKAEKLLLLSDVDGLLNKQEKIIKQLDIKEAEKLIQDGTISGGMLPKINSCIKALRSGVKNVHLISGKIQHSVLLEIFTDYGIGTMLKE